jgi:excisionase family DNA binding protein
MFTVAQVAERLNVSESFVRGLLRSGRLRFHRLGKGQGGIRVSEEQLQAFLCGTESKGGASLPPPRPKPPPLKNFSLS